MPPLFLAFLSIALSVAAQFALKAGMRTPGDGLLSALVQPMVLLGFALYGLGAVVWLSVLARWDVSKAYPLVGLGFVATAVIGHFIGEQMSLLRGLGVLLICGGVLLVARS